MHPWVGWGRQGVSIELWVVEAQVFLGRHGVDVFLGKRVCEVVHRTAWMLVHPGVVCMGGEVHMAVSL